MSCLISGLTRHFSDQKEPNPYGGFDPTQDERFL